MLFVMFLFLNQNQMFAHLFMFLEQHPNAPMITGNVIISFASSLKNIQDFTLYYILLVDHITFLHHIFQFTLSYSSAFSFLLR